MRLTAHNCAASSLAIAFALLTTAPASAQATTTTAADPAATPAPDTTAASPAITSSKSDANADKASAADIVVTGFRSSLRKAIELKRDAIGVRDSIVAEDIGKFPEQNVADSLQRIPGVQLQRDAFSNEGQRINIRGLGPQYSVTTIDNAPVHTTTSSNVGQSVRDFNYDVFPSELFGRVDVYKTPLANLEEGGIGGNVNLQTPRPFDSNGRVLRYSAQANYNDQSHAWNPRGSLLYSNTWGNFGVLLGVAYARNVNERSGFQSTGGNFQGYNSSALGATSYNKPAPPPNTSGPFPFQLDLANPLANLGGYTAAQISGAYLPRFYRVYASSNTRQRIGTVGSLQYKSDRLEISLDGIYSQLKDKTQEFTFGVAVRNSRTVPGTTSPPGTGTNTGIIPLAPKIDQFNNLYGTFGNTDILTESFYRDSQTTFYYGILRGVYEITDNLKLSAQGNYSRSNAWYSPNRVLSLINGIQTTYDPTVSYTYPTISSPVDFTNPNNFTGQSVSFTLNREIDTERTGRAELTWNDVQLGGIKLSTRLGGSYVSTSKKFTLQDGSALASAASYNGTPFSKLNFASYMNPYVQFGAIANGGNPGFLSQFATYPRSFVMGFLNAMANNKAAPINLNSAYTATENVGSGWLEFDATTEIFGHELRADAGIRYSNTSLLINNYNIVGGVFTPVNPKAGYSNWLPSGTLAFDITKKLILRGSVGKTITRAPLQYIAASLYVPNAFNAAYTVGNPDLKPQNATTLDASLEWYFQPGGLLSLGAFKKTLKGAALPTTDQITLAASGLSQSAFNATSLGYPTGQIPSDLLLTRTSYTNASTINLSGIEVAYQQTFHFLPAPFDGLGALASYTRVKSQGYNFTLQGANTQTLSVAYVPKQTVSLTGYYEKGRFSLRATYNYSDRSAVSNVNTGTNQIPYVNARGYLDANISYRLKDWLEFRVDALNLTNVNSYIYYEDPTGPKGNGQSRRDNSFFNGRTFSFGIRGKF